VSPKDSRSAPYGNSRFNSCRDLPSSKFPPRLPVIVETSFGTPRQRSGPFEEMPSRSLPRPAVLGSLFPLGRRPATGPLAADFQHLREELVKLRTDTCRTWCAQSRSRCPPVCGETPSADWRCPLWVISCRGRLNYRCPFCLQKRTRPSLSAMSAEGHAARPERNVVLLPVALSDRPCRSAVAGSGRAALAISRCRTCRGTLRPVL
jgi:hypothetical protein